MSITPDRARALQAMRKNRRGGRPAADRLTDLVGQMDAKRKTGEVLDTLVVAMGTGDVAAARLWLAYRWGKPTAYVQVVRDEELPDLSDDQLNAVVREAL